MADDVFTDLMPRSAHSFLKHSVKELLLFKWHGPAHIWLPAACSWNATDALTGVLVEAGVTRLGRRGPTPRHTKANAGVAMTKTCHSRLYCVPLPKQQDEFQDAPQRHRNCTHPARRRLSCYLQPPKKHGGSTTWCCFLGTKLALEVRWG